MKQKLLDDLIAFLKASPDPGSSSWCDEGDRLLKEVQAERDAIVPYQSRVNYRLEHHYMFTHPATEDEPERIEPASSNVGSRTPRLDKMRARVKWAITKYPLEDFRLYHGSRRIRDIESWLEEGK
jgi:hypothetical protein